MLLQFWRQEEASLGEDLQNYWREKEREGEKWTQILHLCSQHSGGSSQP